MEPPPAPEHAIRHGYRPIIVGAAAVAGAALLDRSGSEAFLPYYGRLDPTAATAAVVVVGGAALLYLRSRGWPIAREGRLDRRAVLFGIALAAAFAAPVIAMDFLGAFPRDINVPPPESILFYPVIALVAECVFHAVPVAILSLMLSPVTRRLGQVRALWCVIVPSALIEPTLQSIWSAPDSPGWATAYVSVHVLAINVTVLYVFRRFGFLSAYAFRTVYYLWWHVLWGSTRLPLLFGG